MREKFLNRNGNARHQKDEANNASWQSFFSPFGFPIQFYGFVGPKREFHSFVGKSFRVTFFPDIVDCSSFCRFSTTTTMASYDFWLCAVNEKREEEEVKKTEHWKRRLPGVRTVSVLLYFFWLFLVFISTIYTIGITSWHTVHSTCTTYMCVSERICSHSVEMCASMSFLLFLVIPLVINEMCAVVWTTSVKRLEYRVLVYTRNAHKHTHAHM